VLRYSEYTAAVKAIAWSSHVHGLLAPRGGTADRCIRFWNTTINSHLSCIDGGSQVSYIYGAVLCDVLDKERLEQNVKKKEEDRKHGLEEHGVIFTKPELKPNGKKKEEEMEPRLEGQGVNFAKPEFFHWDKEDVRVEGWYVQISRAYVAAHVAVLSIISI
jgi:hypothetical protein